MNGAVPAGRGSIRRTERKSTFCRPPAHDRCSTTDSRANDMANDDKSDLTGDDPERSVIERVAQALEDKDAGEAATIVRDTSGAAPLPPRRGG